MTSVRIGEARVDYTAKDAGFSRATRRAVNQTTKLKRQQRLLQRQFQATSRAARQFARSALSIRGSIASLAGSAGLGLFVRNQARVVAEIDNFARSVDVGVEALQALQRAGGDYNIEANQINQGLVRFTRAVGEANNGMATYRRAFDQLGVSLTDTNGNLRGTEDILEDFATKLQDVGSASERNQILMSVFGRQGARLGFLLDGVAKRGLDAYIERQKQAGILTKEQVESLQSLNREFNNLGDVFDFEARSFTVGLAGEWKELIEIAKRGLPVAFETASAVTESVLLPVLREIARNLDGVVAAMASMYLAMSKLPALAGAAIGVFASKMPAAFAATAKAGRNAIGVMRVLGAQVRAGSVLGERFARRTGAGPRDADIFRTPKRLKEIYGDAAPPRGAARAWRAMIRPLSRFGKRLGDVNRGLVFTYRAFGKAGVGMAAFRVTTLAVGGVLKGLWSTIRFGLKLLRPFAAFFAKFLIISTVINLFLDFQATVDRLVRFVKQLWETLKELWNVVKQATDNFFSLDKSISDVDTSKLKREMGDLAISLKDVALASDDLETKYRKLHQASMLFLGASTEGPIRTASEKAAVAAEKAVAEAEERARRVASAATALPTGQQGRINFSAVVRQRVKEREDLERRIEFMYNRSRGARWRGIGSTGPLPIDIANTELERFRRRSQTDAFNKTTESYQAGVRAFDELQEKMERNQKILSSMEGGFQSFFQSLIDGTAKASDAFKKLASDILQAVLRATVIEPIAASISSGIGSFFNLPVPGRATGGPVSARNPYIVGERGPELFVPAMSGSIVPNHRMGGGATNNFIFNIESTDGPGVQRALDAAYPVFVQGAIDAQQEAQDRPGDLYE